MISRIFFLITNNIIFNNIVIWLHQDGWLVSKLGIYKRIKLDQNKSVTEMAGFSIREDVNQALEKVHNKLENIVESNLNLGDSILDIGCGAGAYLKKYENDYNAVGIDLHEDMVAKGKQYAPNVTFILNDFLDEEFNIKFKLIFTIGVLEFIPPGLLSKFFEKIYSLLDDNGILYINYPHALSKKALYFPDLYFIEYSPRYIEKLSLKYKFTILEHQHVFDGRKIITFDNKPYLPGTRTFKNGYNLIAKKVIST